VCFPKRIVILKTSGPKRKLEAKKLLKEIVTLKTSGQERSVIDAARLAAHR
jgi:hypothetical protein